MSTTTSISGIFYLIKRYWFIILLTTFITTGLMIQWIKYTLPVYEASCKLLIVDTNQGGSLLEQTDLVLEELGESDPITTQIEVMKTLPIFKETIRLCNLKNSNSKPLNPKAFANRISIEPIRQSNIVVVSYRGYHPDTAAIVTNTFVKVAEEHNQKLNRKELRNMRLFIEKQLESQKARLEKIEQASVNYKKRERTVDIDLQTSSQIDAARDIELEIMRLQSEREEALAQKRQVESDLDVPRAQADPFYKSKRLKMIEQIDTKLSSIEAQKVLVRKQLEYINNKLSSRPQEEVNLTRFLRDEKIADQTYSNLLSKLQELEIREAAKTASIKLIEPAIPPKFPVSPNKVKLISIALITGIFVGCGIAYLLSSIAVHPSSISAIKNVLPYDILGSVPVVRKKELLIFKESANSALAKSIRNIHTNLNFKRINHNKHINLLVISAIPGEGKSMICANLIFELARTGKRVALVNLDLRRNVFSGISDMKIIKGITDYLSGKAQFLAIHTSHWGIEFDIIDAGETVETPTRLLQKERVDKLFSTLTNEYDICLFYSAPILKASETLDLSRRMTGIILVADMKISNMKWVTAMHEMLKYKDLPVLGTVINRASAYA